MEEIFSQHWKDYQLLDSGNKKKLERFGSVTLIRPEISADHSPEKSYEEWKEMADGEFIEESSLKGKWQIYTSIPETWQISFNEMKEFTLNLKLTPFKHIGVFPEQSVNWERFINTDMSDKKVLNLFAYTGAASLAAASSGAKVTHVDSIKSVVEWGKKNSKLSNIDTIRWICEDAVRFVEREIKRENTYDTIILDPPTWGFSNKKNGWKIERDLPKLMENLQKILENNGEILLNCYSVRIDEKRLNHILYKSNPKLQWEIKSLKNRDSFGKTIKCGFLAIGTPRL